MKTFRLRGHEEASGFKYVPEELLNDWAKRDPIDRLRNQLLDDGIADDERLKSIEIELDRQVDRAAEYAVAQPLEETTNEREHASVFAAVSEITDPSSNGVAEASMPRKRRSKRKSTTRTMRFIDAISDGLRQAMAEDESIVLMGQDVAEYGGAFKVTAGFLP